MMMKNHHHHLQLMGPLQAAGTLLPAKNSHASVNMMPMATSGS